MAASDGRFLRVEVEPETRAHEICRRTRIATGTLLEFGGAVVIDEDGPFVEVHPDEDFGLGSDVKSALQA